MSAWSRAPLLHEGDDDGDFHGAADGSFDFTRNQNIYLFMR